MQGFSAQLGSVSNNMALTVKGARLQAGGEALLGADAGRERPRRLLLAARHGAALHGSEESQLLSRCGVCVWPTIQAC